MIAFLFSFSCLVLLVWPLCLFLFTDAAAGCFCLFPFSLIPSSYSHSLFFPSPFIYYYAVAYASESNNNTKNNNDMVFYGFYVMLYLPILRNR